MRYYFVGRYMALCRYALTPGLIQMQTLIDGYSQNIAHLCSRKNSQTWGNEAWKKVRLWLSHSFQFS